MTKKYESKYQSRHNPGKKVTLGQWMAELMCERKAQADENKELPRRFWIEKHKDKESYQKWQPYLKRQVYTAYRLIDKYGDEKVLQFIRNNRNIYSLTAKWVKDKLDQYQIPKVIKPDTDDTPVKYNENPTWSTDRIKKKSLYDKFD